MPIPPTEYVAWRDATGHIVKASEYDILCDMDAAFCEETDKELEAYRARQEDNRGSFNGGRTPKRR